MQTSFTALSFLNEKVKERNPNFGSLNYLTKAENTSMQSDLSKLLISPELLKRNRTMVLSFIGINSLCYLNAIQQEDLKLRFFKIASKRNWEGKWLQMLARMLKLDNLNPFQLMQIYFEDQTTHDFYGNDYKYILKSALTLKYLNVYIPDVRPVKSKQRKRGYTDKGHLPSNKYRGPRKGINLELKHRKETIERNLKLQIQTPPVFFEDVAPELNTRQGTLVNDAVVLQADKNKTSNFVESISFSTHCKFPQEPQKNIHADEVVQDNHIEVKEEEYKEEQRIIGLMKTSFFT